MKYKAIDLFCGAGGFSKGFEMSDKFEILKGYDINEEALETFNFNHSAEGVNYDITGEVPEELKDAKIDIVIGSPPCQGFSDAKGSRNVGDHRNNLVFHFIRWVKEINPDIVVMENVSGIMTISDDFINDIENEYEKSGYNLNYSILNCAEFGVPQKRKRTIFIATKKGYPKPTIPHPTSKKQLNLLTKSNNEYVADVLVGEAISDLPSPTKNGISNYDIKPKNEYQEIMREKSNKIYNHIAKEPREKDMFIVEKIPEGKMYRSTRFGEKYVGVWNLFQSEFTYEQRLVLWFIARHRGRKAYKATDKSGPDYIKEKTIINSFKKQKVLNEAAKYGFEKVIDEGININKDNIRKLKDKGWLRSKDVNGEIAYDLNSQSGIRPRYMRLNREDKSNTILTTDFNAREKLHPVENRGLSLREGARIQSFPDDFIFKGDFKAIAKQIGNAVPPLLAKQIALHVEKFLEIENEEAI
ncbi:DNA cytosine methyltransferase [Halanaerobacter jeridensis]|uniref:Cytosine-specific methyltransferase n=1 Tax=Halanaerobacter jeridensis TaxID=706427 RepID=A0A938XV64_9FIRM|nr:DNA cytosine methyltransferase [Halanaerobacter jeridensis]MBM7558115.1 DNA-cytosine methyltransferase [Halanaerobacter jeridensis]